MGLGMVESFMAVEESFGLEISGDDASKLTTPRLLIDYLADRLPPPTAGYCLTQRAFYVLRGALARHANLSVRSIHPSTSVRDVIPEPERETTWKSLQKEVGAKRWPRLTKGGWMEKWFVSSDKMHLLSDVAKYLARHSTSALASRDAAQGWTRNQIARVIHRLVQENFGLSRQEYTEDSRWIEDIGAD
jgi:acyl carrier protein